MISEKQKKWTKDWQDRNYDSVSVRWPKEFCAELRSVAKQSGESLAGYMKKAIETRMRADEKESGEG